MSSLPATPLDNTPPHERYLFKPLQGSSHSWALERLLPNVAGKRVLDIGAGGGGIGRAIRERAPSELVAIEVDDRSHALLAETYDLVIPSIAPLKGRTFDWIILLDVLEHMANPQEFVDSLRELLAPGGKIIASVPNIAHWSVRVPLFFWGSFEYQSRGIMDKTHLQFFTRGSFARLFARLRNCRLVEASASIEPFEFILPKWMTNNPLYRGLIPLRLLLARSLPGLMAYQHLVVVQDQS